MQIVRHSVSLAGLAICLFVVPAIARGEVEAVPDHASAPHSEHHGLSKLTHCHPLRDLVIGTAVTGLSFPLDDNIRSELTENPRHDMVWTDIGNGYGNGIFIGVTSLATTGLGFAIGNDDLRRTGTTLVEGVAIELVAVYALKHAISRERPDSSDSRSFPSGHSAGAFTVSTILTHRYGWRMAIPTYALAVTTACARMKDNRHYLSDVVAGAALGVAIGELVSRHPDHDSRTVEPVIGARGFGMRMRF